jgi:hypothetical protein
LRVNSSAKAPGTVKKAAPRPRVRKNSRRGWPGATKGGGETDFMIGSIHHGLKFARFKNFEPVWLDLIGYSAILRAI